MQRSEGSTVFGWASGGGDCGLGARKKMGPEVQCSAVQWSGVEWRLVKTCRGSWVMAGVRLLEVWDGWVAVE